nr:hypothetical protein [uncultured Sellimonas sp.]
MEHKLPYYMAYPKDFKDYDEEKRERRDLEYMKSMYPITAKKVLPYVEEECDRMEYEGSMIYDEYPDRLMLYLMSGRIYDRMEEDEKRDMKQEVEENRQMDMQSYRKQKRESSSMDIIELLLYHEILRRRCKYRKQCRRYY